MLADVVRKKILGCSECHLREGCSSPVPFTGRTPSRYLFLGEGPGEVEDEKGEPFVGPAGGLVRRAIRLSGIPAGEVAFANIVCCRPPKNRAPSEGEIEACRNNLRLQMAAVNPKVVVLLGGTALGIYRSDWKITTHRGRPFTLGVGVVAVPTIHPAAVLRRSGFWDWILADIRQARWRGRVDLLGRWPQDCSVAGCEEEMVVADEMGAGYCQGHEWMRGRGIVTWGQKMLVA